MIPIRNIYYMLSYAFQQLKSDGYRHLADEQFENFADLAAGILILGTSNQIRRGMRREYLNRTENLSVLRGKLEFEESINIQMLTKKQLVCTYDEFSLNNYPNQIIKSSLYMLLSADISKERKREIRKLMVFLEEIDLIDLRSINWTMSFDRNNLSYDMLIGVCRLVVEGLLQTQEEGSNKLGDFLDEQKEHALYEAFVRAYFRKEHPMLYAGKSHINWMLDWDSSSSNPLPLMKADIILEQGKTTFIIDTKYYRKNLTEYYGSRRVYSSDLYQIFAYVKNYSLQKTVEDPDQEVMGLLLYAKTDDHEQAHGDYQMSGNKIMVRTLDLDQEFMGIKQDLDQIAGLLEERAVLLH